MFYSHFDESKKTKAIVIILYIAGVLVPATYVIGLLFLAGLLLRGERDFLILLLLLMTIFPVVYVSMYPFWLLRRASFSEEGIVIQRLWKKETYPWDTIEEYGVFSISLFTSSNITPYFFFILSSPTCIKKHCKNLSDCFLFRRNMIAIRYSENRNRQVEGFLKKNTKIYDWNSRKWTFEWNPNRDPRSSPQSPYPKWQKYEEEKRNRKLSRRHPDGDAGNQQLEDKGT